MRALVIGGGIGGLTATIVLRQLGFETHVYEQAPVLAEVGAGIGLATNALRALDVIGLAAPLRAQSLPEAQGELRDNAGRVLTAVPAGEYGILSVMHRAELLALLAARIEPDWLHLDRSCIAIEQGPAGVTARFQNGETASGDVLVAADGLRSSVRAQLFANHQVRYAGYTAWRCVVEYRQHLNPNICETWGRGCRFGIVPMSRGRVYWFATRNDSEGERDPEGLSKLALLKQFRGWHAPIEALIDAAEEGSILRHDIYDMDPLPHCAAGRTALLGDAAHAMTPNLGQGACQAIEDAVVLGACLKKHGRVEAALDEYARRRAPRTRQVLLQSRRVGVLAQQQNPLLCWIRDAAMRAIPGRVSARQMKSMLEFEILDPSERALFR